MAEDTPKRVGLNPALMRNRRHTNLTSQDEFEENVGKITSTMADHRNVLTELATKFVQTLRDKTLAENKMPLSKQNEASLLGEIINTVQAIDTDENEPVYDYGTYTLLTLLLRCFILQRNRINELSYMASKVESLVNANADLKKQVSSLTEKLDDLIKQLS
jgi:hypothetical protein